LGSHGTDILETRKRARIYSSDSQEATRFLRKYDISWDRHDDAVIIYSKVLEIATTELSFKNR
jgi:hypothetical protein